MKITKYNRKKDTSTVSSTTGSIAVSQNQTTSLESHTLWGQQFDGTNDVSGDINNAGNIDATGNITINSSTDNSGNVVGGNLKADSTITGNNIVSNNDVTSKTVNASESVTTNVVNSNSVTATESVHTKDATIDNNLVTKDATVNNKLTSTNITNSDTIKTKNLQVTGTAHFFNLIIDKIKSAGGAALFTPADGFDVDIVQDDTNEVKLLWQCQDEDGNQRDNMWKVNDQALCMSFNKAKVGTTHNVSNKYYWALVTGVNPVNEPMVVDGVKYNYISLSKTIVDGTLNPEFGDSIVMCGYRGTDDAARQSAIYISAYSSLDNGLTAPLLAQYKGINDFNLESHRNSYYDAVSAKFIGEFEATDGQNIIDIINNKIAESEASIKLDTKNIVLSVSEKTKERRNLLKGTTFHRQIDNFFISNAARIEMNSGYNGTNCIKVIDDLDGNQHFVGVYWDGSQPQGGRSIKIEKGKKYTISCYFKTNDTSVNFTLEAIYTDKESNAKRLGRPKYLSTDNFTPKYNQWELFTAVIDTTDAESDYIAFNFWENCIKESGKIEAYICRPMVEEGDTYYGWTVSDEDNDYIGANLIDNSRTFEVGGNTLEVKGTKTLKGDVYELMYEGSAKYNTFYKIDTTNFKLDTDYTLSFDVKGNAKYINVSAYYPITKTPYTLLNEPMDTPMSEQNGDGTKEGYTTLLVDSNIEREKKIWVHFKFIKRLPQHIYFQFPNNSDQSGVTSWNMTITKPKIEEGANVTEWTEKKTDIDNTITTINSNVATLDQKADGISAKVSENTTTINNINGQVTTNKTNIANLTVKADGIESTVSSMSNGTGTNLFSFTNANFNIFNCMPAIQMNGFFTLGLNQRLYRVMYLECNGVTGDYVVSFDARVLNDDGTGTVVNVNFCDENPIENNGDIKVYNWFKHYVLHFKNVQATYLRKDLYDGFIDFEPKVQDANNQLYVANFMLERGTIPSANFTLSEADRNNFKSNNVFTAFDKASTATIVDETINGKAVKAYKQEGLPKDTEYIDTLAVHDLEKKFKIEPWKVYTLSFWAKSSISGRAIQNFLYPNIANAGLQNILYKDINGAGTQTAYTAATDGYTACELDKTWRKFYVHWQPHQLPESYACVCGRIISSDLTVWIAEPKLEEGYICDENISNQDTYSSISQTANEILAQVNDTYVKIGDGNITLNGDTKVNGSLTLNGSKQGFLLLGNGGTTEISPKSIGSYTAFKDRTSNVIRTHYLSDIHGELNVGTNNYAFFWSVTQKLGTYKKGDYIQLTNYTNDVVTSVGTNIGTPYAKFYITENGTQTKAIDIGVKTNVDIDNYTVVNDNADIQVTGQFHIYAPKSIWNQARGIDTNIPNIPFISVTVEWDNEVPNKNSFMLIGYDGFGVNFGTNKTVYCGAEGFIANYGDSLFKITSDGIVEKKNGANVAIVNGSSSIYSPSYYNLKEGVDTILCKSGYTIITLPSEPYQGQSVKIFDKSPQEVYVNFNGYMVGANSDYNSRTHQTKYVLDGTAVRTFTYIGDTWFMEYMG